MITKSITGKIKCTPNDLNLKLTLLGGQSFRWKIEDEYFIGVFNRKLWKLKYAAKDFIEYEVFVESSKLNQHNLEFLLKKYFRMDFNLKVHYDVWKKCHNHFYETSQEIKSVRVLDQEPFENIISFICSQNNNITRISSMVENICMLYGDKICSYNNKDIFAFPTVEKLASIKNLEDVLRKEKFGYRAKMISQAVQQILIKGGDLWFEKLKFLDYARAREELLKISGIGPKVADCICLMSLGKMESVPVDRHIFKIAQDNYMPEMKKIKLSPKQYEVVAKMYRDTYGQYAGWAQTVLFCSGIQRQ